MLDELLDELELLLELELLEELLDEELELELEELDPVAHTAPVTAGVSTVPLAVP